MGTPIRLTEQTIRIAAPREQVFRMIANAEQGFRPGTANTVRVLSRSDNTIVAEFITGEGAKRHRTVEEIVAFPPDRIVLRWLESPTPSLKEVTEELRLRDTNRGTEIHFSGQFRFDMPVIGGLLGGSVARSRFDKLVTQFLEDIKFAAEARVRLGESPGTGTAR